VPCKADAPISFGDPDFDAQEDEVVAKLEQLITLLPVLAGRIGTASTADLIRVSAAIPDVGQRVLDLRTAFPSANLVAMVSAEPRLLLRDARDLQASLSAARQLLAPCAVADVDRVIERAPHLLDERVLASVLSEIGRLFPTQHPAEVLSRNPTLAATLTGLQDQQRGGRDASYLSDTLSAS
jgi:hypothetical protein